MDKDLNDFKRFMKEREAAAEAFTNGDGEPELVHRHADMQAVAK
jgi:hypothetical protein